MTDKREPKVGDHVRVKNSLLYTGRTGTVLQTSGNIEDFWDHYVGLVPTAIAPGRVIGVTRDQIEMEAS